MAEHEGRQERWVDASRKGSITSGWSYVRWVCSCGVNSKPFIDQGNECEQDWQRHAGVTIDREA